MKQTTTSTIDPAAISRPRFCPFCGCETGAATPVCTECGRHRKTDRPQSAEEVRPAAAEPDWKLRANLFYALGLTLVILGTPMVLALVLILPFVLKDTGLMLEWIIGASFFGPALITGIRMALEGRRMRRTGRPGRRFRAMMSSGIFAPQRAGKKTA